MPWPMAVERWFPCVQPNVQEAIITCIGAYTTPGHTLAGNIYDVIAILYLGGTGSDEERAFRAIYRVIENTFPLPPPLDRTYFFPPTYWNPMEDYLADSPDIDISECPVIKFKGNQGGAWPPIP